MEAGNRGLSMRDMPSTQDSQGVGARGVRMLEMGKEVAKNGHTPRPLAMTYCGWSRCVNTPRCHFGCKREGVEPGPTQFLPQLIVDLDSGVVSCYDYASDSGSST